MSRRPRGPLAGEVALTVAADGAPRDVRLGRTKAEPVEESRPAPIAEIRPCVMCVHSCRATDE